MADIPGLIEGAAEGRGLGHDFLRHVERARVLCVLLDLSEMAPHAARRISLTILLRELGDYQADLLERPRVVVGSKGDAAAYEMPGVADDLVDHRRGDRPAGRASSPDSSCRSDAKRSSASSTRWSCTGRSPTRSRSSASARNEWIVDGTAGDSRGAIPRPHRRRSAGRDRAAPAHAGRRPLLTRAGVRDGDVVNIGPLSFEWWRDDVSAGLDRGDHHRASRRERLARHGRLDLGERDGDS